MDAVPHAHLHLRLLHPVACGVVQLAHNPAEEEEEEGKCNKFKRSSATKLQTESSASFLQSDQLAFRHGSTAAVGHRGNTTEEDEDKEATTRLSWC